MCRRECQRPRHPEGAEQPQRWPRTTHHAPQRPGVISEHTRTHQASSNARRPAVHTRRLATGDGDGNGDGDGRRARASGLSLVSGGSLARRRSGSAAEACTQRPKGLGDAMLEPLGIGRWAWDALSRERAPWGYGTYILCTYAHTNLGRCLAVPSRALRCAARAGHGASEPRSARYIPASKIRLRPSSP